VVGQHPEVPTLHPLHEARTPTLPVIHQRESHPGWIGRQLLRGGLTGYFLFQPRHQLLLQYLQQTRIHRPVDHEKRLPVGRIDPVIGRRPQAEPLAGNIVPGQAGLFPVIHPHVPIHVQGAHTLRVRRHPVLAQLLSPPRYQLLLPQMRQLLAQRPHFRNPVQPQHFSPFPGRTVTESLQRLDPRQRQKRHQHQHLDQTVITPGQRQVLLRVPQQPGGQQRRQRQQHPRPRYIRAPLKTRGHRPRSPQRRQHPPRRIAGPHSQWRLSIRRASLTVGAQFRFPAGRVFFTARCNRPAWTALVNVL
jgi:hypothetical protein